MMTPEEFAAICELVGIAALCSWTVCLAVGRGFCAPDRAMLLGVPGTLLGGLLFEHLGLAVGPTLGGYPVLPGLVGTIFMLAVTAYVKRVHEEIQHTKEEVRHPSLRALGTAHSRAR